MFFTYVYKSLKSQAINDFMENELYYVTDD